MLKVKQKHHPSNKKSIFNNCDLDLDYHLTSYQNVSHFLFLLKLVFQTAGK